MKKSLLIILGLLIMTSTANIGFASDSDVMKGVKLYRAGNYTKCYEYMQNIVKQDPSNALAYYYLAISAAQVGRKEEAIDNYDKVITLSSLNSNIGRYANKGKVCIETPESCDSISINSAIGDAFILSKQGPQISDDVKKQLEQFKREELIRDINRNENIDPQRFKEYKDFSSMNIQDVPTNDEIVAALRTLQKAGLNNTFNNGITDISMLTGAGHQNQLFNMMGGNSSLSPQVIQALLTNNMTQGF